MAALGAVEVGDPDRRAVSGHDLGNDARTTAAADDVDHPRVVLDHPVPASAAVDAHAGLVRADHPGPAQAGQDGRGLGIEAGLAAPERRVERALADAEADQRLASRFDKVDLPKVAPVVTRVERYAGHCRCCGATTLAPLPEGLEPGTPFSPNIVALAMYLRFAHHVSYRRLSRLMLGRGSKRAVSR